MIGLDEKVKLTGVREAIKDLRGLDKDIIKQLRKDLKGAVLPVAQRIAAKVPTQSPLSGFNHAGRTRWTGARATVNFTPGTIRKGQDVHPLVSITLQGKGNGAGFDIAEIAGSRDNAFSRDKTKSFKLNGVSRRRTQTKRMADTFVRNLGRRAPFNLKAGRFGFGFFLKERAELQKISTDIIMKTAETYNRRIRRR